jgi:hypothetical protein
MQGAAHPGTQPRLRNIVRGYFWCWWVMVLVVGEAAGWNQASPFGQPSQWARLAIVVSAYVAWCGAWRGYGGAHNSDIVNRVTGFLTSTKHYTQAATRAAVGGSVAAEAVEAVDGAGGLGGWLSATSQIGASREQLQLLRYP